MQSEGAIHADVAPVRIRNSEAETQATCRRKWDFSGALRRNLMPTGESVGALWFGTGFHFALEDYHGYDYFGDPALAWGAYVNATPREELPADWDELLYLGDRMLSYYTEHWLPRRDDLRTLWVDGRPQVEVRWEVEVPGSGGVVATGTFDRVATDPWGRLVLVDYKTYRRQDQEKLGMDRQVSTYLWAAGQIYGEVLGLYHQQHTKAAPEGPRKVRGNVFSKDKSQATTHALYTRVLEGLTDAERLPYAEILNHLAQQEDGGGDALIRRTLVTRDPRHLENHGRAMAAQYREMADPALPIYPNVGYHCKWCPFKQPCLATDLGADTGFLLREGFVSRDQPVVWMARIAWPDGQIGERIA